MRVLEGLDGLRHLPHGATVSIGNFDGVHLGHRQILHAARKAAAGPVAVVTFEPHPFTVLRPQAVPPRLTPPSLKRTLLEEMGVDWLVVLPPARQVLDLTAEQFWAILRDEVRPGHLIEGGNFTFGKDRAGTTERLVEWARGTGIGMTTVEPVCVPLLNLQIVAVSSSLIRWLLRHGRVRDAAICLGRPYTLEGKVIEGHRRGRTIGVPTANLDAADQLLPADGVYSGRCTIDGRTHAAAVSIGIAPTFGDSRRQVEAHLLDFTGDLYGRTIRLEFTDWLRDQIRFDGIDALKAQLSRDITTAATLCSRRAEQPIARTDLPLCAPA